MVELAPQMERPRMMNLQVLRGIAALMVFFHHFTPYLAKLYPSAKLLGFGASGVDIFFVLSGFIMVSTTQRGNGSGFEFIWNRFSRVAPLYWGVTMVMVALYMIGFKPVGLINLDPSYIVKSILFIPFVRSDKLEPIVAPGWTLNYEMFFYALFAVGLFLISGKKRYWALIATIFLISLSGMLDIFDDFYLHYYANPIILDFAFGMLIGIFFSRDRSDFDVNSSLVASVILVVFAVGIIVTVEIIALSGGPRLEYIRGARPMTWGIAGAALVFAASLLDRIGLSARSGFLAEIGNASFSLYLIHSLVLHATSKIAERMALNGVSYVGLVFVVGLSLTLFISFMLFRYFEVPSNKLLRRMLPVRERSVSV
jgi:exopolysaccharide production protein ExoZ